MADFRHGEPVTVDHTPGGAVTAGDVVLVGDSPQIAHSDIAAGVLGALAAHGGVYSNAADAAIASGKDVFWDAGASKVTETSAGNKHLGSSQSATAADGDLIDFLHTPNGTEGV